MRKLWCAPLLVAIGLSSCDVGTGPAGLAGVLCSKEAHQLAARNSALLLAGRTSPLEVSVLGVREAGAPMNVVGTEARWESSNVSVVSVDGSTATAHAPGTATLVASACGVADTVEVAVVTRGYAVTFLGDSSEARYLNDLGEVVGRTGYPHTTHWHWKAGSTTSLGSCSARGITSRSVVLCAGPGPTTWRDGVTTVHDTLSGFATALNDSNHVIFSARSAVWVGPGNLRAVQAPLSWRLALLNERGDVAGVDAFMYPDVIQVFTSGAHRFLGAYGRYSSPGAMNRQGDIVGSGEALTPITQIVTAVIWLAPDSARRLPRAVRGPGAANPIASAATGINDHRVVVGNGDRGGWVLVDRRLGVLSELVTGWRIESTAGINNAGQIIGQGHNLATGQRGAVLLTPQ